jgi:hypothetical protein
MLKSHPSNAANTATMEPITTPRVIASLFLETDNGPMTLINP